MSLFYVALVIINYLYKNWLLDIEFLQQPKANILFIITAIHLSINVHNVLEFSLLLHQLAPSL